MIEINEKLKIYFPLPMKPRDNQLDGIEFVKKSINNRKKYILMNLPTGSGKSYFAIMFMNWYRNFVNEGAKFDILTNSKILQDQYMKDYPYMKNFKGKVNYKCHIHNTDCKKGWDICKGKAGCGMDCSYLFAKSQWINSDVGITNFHLFNTLSLFAPKPLIERSSNVLIIDEAHDFESVFCDFISTPLSAKALKKYGFDSVKIFEYDDQIKRIKNISDFVGFIENQFIEDIKMLVNELEQKPEDNTILEYINHCTTQITKFNFLVKEYKEDKENWILDITKNLSENNMYSGILLEAKPVWGRKYLKQIIFKNYDHVIMMSGSILNPEMFSFINGLNTKYTSYFETPSTFPIKNRPMVYMNGIGKMTYTKKYDTFENQLKIIKQILKKHENVKGIIHAGTYEISKLLEDRLSDYRLIFHNSENRDEMLQKHINSKDPTIIVSPSMISGVDLKDELSRFQVIMKIPYPFLGSEKIKARKKTKNEWYNWKTVIDFIQMIGRSIRSHDDYAKTYILDDSFKDMLRYNALTIPTYISDAIKKIKV